MLKKTIEFPKEKQNETMNVPFPVDEDLYFSVKPDYWNKINNRAKLEKININDLWSYQTKVDKEFVKKLIKSNEAGKEPPWIYRMPDGKLLIQDGNHRLTALKIMGKKSAIAYVANVYTNELY